jgi:hypothetical protein
MNTGPPKYEVGMLPQNCSVWFTSVEIIHEIQLTRIRVQNMRGIDVMIYYEVQRQF